MKYRCAHAEVNRRLLICVLLVRFCLLFWKILTYTWKCGIVQELDTLSLLWNVPVYSRTPFDMIKYFGFFYNIRLSSIKSFISVLRLAPGVNDKSKLKVCNQSDRGLCSLSSNFVLWKKWCDFVTLDLACLLNKTKWLL